MLIISIILGAMLFNFIIYSATAYIDSRYHISDEHENFNDPMIAVLLFGVVPAIYVTVVFIGKYFKKKSAPTLKPHTYFGKLGQKHREQDKDVTYQLEKAVFGDKR